MMMGAGLLFMLLFAVVIIGLPLLIIVLVAGGGLAALLKSLSGGAQSPATPVLPKRAPARPVAVRCDRGGTCAPRVARR